MEALSELDKKDKENFVLSLINNMTNVKEKRYLMRKTDLLKGFSSGFYAVKFGKHFKFITRLGNLKLLKIFIKSGFDIRSRDIKGRTVYTLLFKNFLIYLIRLHLAAKYGNVEIIDSIIKYAKSLESQNLNLSQ
jgi:hypothetical protein